MQSQEGGSQYEVTLGPIKIKDGLFMGDELAAKDIQFIISNKVTHIVNTVVQSIPNLWEKFGVHYLSVGWTEKETKVFDKSQEAISTIFQFIEEAMEKGESCLVHSINGKSRASMVIVAYLMRKYQWSLAKCLQYIDSRKERLQIRVNYLRQLEDMEDRVKEALALNDSWNAHTTKEELIINNTFKNSQSNHEQYYEVPDYFVSNPNKHKNSRRVTWGQPEKFDEKTKISQPPANKDEITVKSILKELQPEANQDIFPHRKGSELLGRRKSNTSDSLDKLLFEDTRKNLYQMSYSDADKGEEERQTDLDNNNHFQQHFQNHYFKPFQPKVSRKTTINNGPRPYSLDSKDLFDDDERQSDQALSIKKKKHYQQVLASYKSIKSQSQSEKHIKLKGTGNQILKTSMFNMEKNRRAKSKSTTIFSTQKAKPKSSGIIQKGNSPNAKNKRAHLKMKVKIAASSCKSIGD